MEDSIRLSQEQINIISNLSLQITYNIRIIVTAQRNNLTLLQSNFQPYMEHIPDNEPDTWHVVHGADNSLGIRYIIIRASACDFQQCGILTCVDSD